MKWFRSQTEGFLVLILSLKLDVYNGFNKCQGYQLSSPKLGPSNLLTFLGNTKHADSLPEEL